MFIRVCSHVSTRVYVHASAQVKDKLFYTESCPTAGWYGAGTAYIVMAYTFMVYVIMAYIVMAYIGMELEQHAVSALRCACVYSMH